MASDNKGKHTEEMAEAIPVSDFKLDSMQEAISVIALKIIPKHIAGALKELSDVLLNQARRPNVVGVGADAKEKLVLLNPEFVPSLDKIPEACQVFADAHQGTFTLHEVITSYSCFTFDYVLKKLLPVGVEVPGSFETIGHVAHLNLRPPQEPYRLLIAQVMLDKYPAIKTVVHKTGEITNEFRVFTMEVLADKLTCAPVPRIAGPSDPALDATVKQNGCSFKLNFGDVYWNSRLEGEHARLVSTFTTHDRIWDMMAGIGPFAVAAARAHGCQVDANDLNPRSHHYLQQNCTLNKVDKLVTAHKMCARLFLRHMVHACGDKVPADRGRVHCIMNLPASAPEFMDAFRHAFDPAVWRPHELPMVHLYAFHKSDDPEECKRHIMSRAEAALGTAIPVSGVAAHTVRDVAPKKLMLCCSFPLPPAAAYKCDNKEDAAACAEVEEAEAEVEEDRQAKRAKT